MTQLRFASFKTLDPLVLSRDFFYLYLFLVHVHILNLDPD